LRDASDEHNG
jgi:quinol monooxygenase YgiN